MSYKEIPSFSPLQKGRTMFLPFSQSDKVSPLAKGEQGGFGRVPTINLTPMRVKLDP
jgi:hypothetical protein